MTEIEFEELLKRNDEADVRNYLVKTPPKKHTTERLERLRDYYWKTTQFRSVEWFLLLINTELDRRYSGKTNKLIIGLSIISAIAAVVGVLK